MCVTDCQDALGYSESKDGQGHGADHDLVGAASTKGVEFFRRFESTKQIIHAWTTETLGSVGVNSLVIIALAHKRGDHVLAERLLIDEWRSSQGHPSLPFIEELAHQLGVSFPRE